MMGYSSDRDVIRGTYVSQPDNPGDFYMTQDPTPRRAST